MKNNQKTISVLYGYSEKMGLWEKLVIVVIFLSFGVLMASGFMTLLVFKSIVLSIVLFILSNFFMTFGLVLLLSHLIRS